MEVTGRAILIDRFFPVSGRYVMDKRFEMPFLSGFFLKASEVSFICLLIFTPFAFGTVQTWSQMVSHFVVYATLIFYLGGKVLSASRRVSFPAAVMLLFVFLLWSAVSTIWITVYQYKSIIYMLRIIDYTLIAFYVSNHFTAEEKREKLIVLISGIGALIALFGLLNYFAGPSIIQAYAGLGSIGASAPYVNHNHFAGYLEMALFCALGLFFFSFNRVKPEASLLFLALILAMFVGLLFSLSRAGIITFLLVLTVFALASLFRRRTGYVLTPAILMSSLAIGYLSILETEKVENRLKTLGDSDIVLTLGSRTSAWKAAYKGIKDNPLKGYGPGNFETALPPYREPGFRHRFYYAHNDYLQLWFEYGVIGVVLVIGGLCLYWKRLWKLLWKTREPSDYLMLGPAAGVLALLLHSFMDFNLYLHANALLFISLAGLLSVGQSNSPGKKTRNIPLLVSAVLILLLIACGMGFSLPALRASRLERQAAGLAADASHFESIELYQKAWLLVPRNAAYPFKLGHDYVLAARHLDVPYFRIKAREYFDVSLKLNPNASEVWLAKAFLAFESGKNEEAEECFAAAVKCDPQNPACDFYQSDYFLAVNKYSEAVLASKKGLTLAPTFLNDRLGKIWNFTQDIDLIEGMIPESFNQGHFLLARHLYQKNHYKESLENLFLCDSSTRQTSPFYSLAGQNYLALNQADSAESYFTRGIEEKPEQMQNYRSLALLLFRQARFEHVQQVFEKALADPYILDKSPLHYEYAMYFGLKKDFKSQREQLNIALTVQVNNPAYLELLADSYIGEVRYYEALGVLRKVERIDSRRISALRKTAGIYETLGQKERAVNYCKKILSISRRDRVATDMLNRLAPADAGGGNSG